MAKFTWHVAKQLKISKEDIFLFTNVDKGHAVSFQYFPISLMYSTFNIVYNAYPIFPSLSTLER